METEGPLQHSRVPASFHCLAFPFFILGVSQLGNKTRPGHCNLQNLRFSSDWCCICVCCSVFCYSTCISEWRTAPTFRAGTPFAQVPYVAECPVEGLGNMRHLREWGTSSEGGATICHVQCINPSFLTFFQVGEKTQ
jgi:hypothetical protein